MVGFSKTPRQLSTLSPSENHLAAVQNRDLYLCPDELKAEKSAYH